MKTSKRCKMLAKKSWSTSLSSWLGNRIAPVLKSLFKRRNISLKLSLLEWNRRKSWNMKLLLSNLSNKQSKMLNVIFKKLKGISITKIKSLRRKQWVRDTPLITTNEKRQSSMVTPRINTEIFWFRQRPMTSMKLEEYYSRKRSKSLRKRFLFLKSLFSKLFMILKKRKSFWNSSMSRSSKNREKISLVSAKT